MPMRAKGPLETLEVARESRVGIRALDRRQGDPAADGMDDEAFASQVQARSIILGTLSRDIAEAVSLISLRVTNPGARVVLYSYYVNGDTYKEIADHMGRSLRWVYDARARGLRELGVDTKEARHRGRGTAAPQVTSR